MSVDMFERRFRQELGRVERFAPQGRRDERVWRQEFPAWRALFSSLCLYGHSTGYRLFSYADFVAYCRSAYCKAHPNAARFQPYFEGELWPGMQERLGVWYESGMTEVYLYVCLVEALEDQVKQGVVLYDPRVDWKLKGDLVVLLQGQALMVSAFYGDLADRAAIEARRDQVERVRKVNTMASAHWENRALAHMHKLTISRTASDFQEVNGVRLFSLPAINGLLVEIYAFCQVKDGYLFPV